MRPGLQGFVWKKKEVIVAACRRAGREPAIWRGRSIGLSKGNHIYKEGGNRRVDKLMKKRGMEP